MRKHGKWIPVVLTVLWCLVLWQFSLAPGKVSSGTSGRVVDFCNEILKDMGIEAKITGKVARKAAHFSEFFLLGVLASLSFLAHGFRHWYWLCGLVIVPVAAIDECIQLFVPERGPHILDVLLDTAGGVCGTLALFIIIWFVGTVKKKVHS